MSDAANASNLAVDDPGPLCNETELTAVEFAHFIQLPEDYRRFMLQWNGGIPRPAGIPLSERVDAIRTLYSIGASTPMFDQTGALLVIDLEPSKDQYGAVFHLGIRPRHARKFRLRYVSPSFNALLGKLVDS